MKERVWKSGPPPHVGWWNASIDEDPKTWRWWNGKDWCRAVYPSSHLSYVANVAVLAHDEGTVGIRWTDYYPENARVPRVDPSAPKNTQIVACINSVPTSRVPQMWEQAAWKAYDNQQNLDRMTGDTRTVREMKERLKTVPAAGSNGQPPAQNPERRELGDPFHGISTMELMKEVFRRLG